MSFRDCPRGALELSALLAGGLSAQAMPTPSVLILADQARRELALIFAAHSTELLGCLGGDLRGDTVEVERIAPADDLKFFSRSSHRN
jgi:hypothetical protein